MWGGEAFDPGGWIIHAGRSAFDRQTRPPAGAYDRAIVSEIIIDTSYRAEHPYGVTPTFCFDLVWLRTKDRERSSIVTPRKTDPAPPHVGLVSV